MARSRIQKSLLGLSVLLLLSAVLAPEAAAQRYRTHIFTTEDGLPSLKVGDVVQDSMNRLWFATRNGIAVYDGIRWTNVKDAQGPDIQNFSRIAVDGRGRFWAATGDWEIFRFEPGKEWEPLPSTGGGNSWWGISAVEVLEREGEEPALFYVNRIRIGMCQGEVWRLLDREEVPDTAFNDVTPIRDTVFVATDRGLFTLQTRPEFSLHPYEVPGMPEGPMYKIEPEWERPGLREERGELQRIWLHGRGWIGYLEEGRFTLLAPAHNLMMNGIPGYFTKLQPDYCGGIVYGSLYGIYHVNARGEEQRLGEHTGLAADGLFSLFMDREYTLWVPGPRGVSAIPSFRFAIFDQGSGLLENEVSSLLRVGPDSFVVGHNTGLSFLGPEGVSTMSFEPPYDDMARGRVHDLKRDGDGVLWMALRNGLGRLREDRSLEMVYSGEPLSDLVSSFLLDGDDVLLGTLGGLLRIGPDGEVASVAEDCLDGEYVRVLEWGRDREQILVGTSMTGLWEIGGPSCPNYSNPGARLTNNIFAVQPWKGDILTGALRGLVVPRGDSLALWNRGFRLEKPVFQIQPDRADRLWLGTDDGVYRWDGSVLRHYGLAEGLPALETNRTATAVDSLERVWIGTVGGIARYDGMLDEIERIPPPEVKLVELSLEEGWEPLRASFESESGSGSLLYRVLAPTFLDPERTRMQYYLEGGQQGWTDPEPMGQGTIRFLNLGPGRYRLHVRVRNALGVWGEEYVAPEVRIPVPFARSPLFFVIMAATAVLLLTGLFRLMLQQRYARRLQNEVREKTSELERHRSHLSDLVAGRTEDLTLANRVLEQEVQRSQQMQRELAKSNAHGESIFQTVGEALVTVDGEGRITKANQGFCKLLQERRCVGQPLVEKLPLEEILERALRGETVREQPVEVQLRGSGERLLQVSASLLQPVEGAPTLESEVLLVLRDITRLENLEREVAQQYSYHNIIGRNTRMREVYNQVEALSGTLATVLVTGESGTGKELIAAALHHSSPRAGGPFVRLNCTALPQGMLESELFGHVKGAFTDAHRDRAGRFESARGGTLFLDEIGDISEQMQVKLLRVLESGEFERVGDSVTLKTDARIISATNRDLERRIEEGKFRRDLYYRLNVIQIHLPPLRERQEDIPLLVEHFLAEVEQDGGGTPTLSPDAMDLMMRYPWPGNVRELRNCIEHALIVCRGAVILPRHLPQRIRQAGAAAEASPGLGADASLARLQRLGEGELELGSGLDEQEQRARVVRALDATLWNVSRAAELLGVSRNTVYRKIRQWELKRPDEDSTEPGE